MNTREIATEYRLAHLAGIMRERNESGLSVKAFCAKAGLHENNYFYWQRKLREAACSHLAKVEEDTANVALTGFTEVKLASQTVIPSSPATHESQISIEASGIRITADREYPISKLVELLREVTRPC